MDSDFMSNLSNMFNSGNIPDELKSMLNNFKANSENNNSNSFNNENSTFENTNESNNSNINPEMLKNIMNMFNNSNNSNGSSDSTNSNNSNSAPNIDINTLLKMKSIMDKINSNKNDPRSNLLLSLKPYLKESRKNKVEQYVQLFNMTKVIDVFNQNGGENVK